MATKLLAYILAAVLAPALAIAAPITSLYVVGDSLSDQENGFLLTGGAFLRCPTISVRRMVQSLSNTWRAHSVSLSRRRRRVVPTTLCLAQRPAQWGFLPHLR